MITAVIPVSTIRQHPETSILEETVSSVRYHLPDAELFLCFDGVRPEQEDRRADYEESIRRTLWLAKQWGAVCPYVFDDHLHQSGMMRRVIEDIETPMILFVEQDTPLVTDEPIDWQAVTQAIECGDADLVRFSHEAHILPDHEHLMLGRTGEFMRTVQWSQRPHVASTAYYRRILDAHFSPDAKCFIEDRMYSVCEVSHRRDGLAGWMQHRLMIYHPAGGNIKRSYHLDGRAGEAKYDGDQVF